MSCAVARATASRYRFRAGTGAVSPIAADARAAVGGRDGVSAPEVEPDRGLRTEPLVADVRDPESERTDTAEDRDEEPAGEPEVLDGSADATPCPVARAAPTPSAKASGPIRPTTLTRRASASSPSRPTPGFLAETMLSSAEPEGSQALSFDYSPCVNPTSLPTSSTSRKVAPGITKGAREPPPI